MLSLFQDVALFIAISLATYRVARLIAVDDGPLDIFYKLRVKFGGYDYGMNGEPKSSWGKFIICPYCVGMWMALVFSLIAYPLDWSIFLYWFAIAGFQAFLESLGIN